MLSDVYKQAFADYVRMVMDELHLKDWSCDVQFDTPSLNEDAPGPHDEYECQAQVDIGLYRKTAEFSFDPDMLLKASPEDIRQTVVHEIIHIHMGGLWHWMRIQLIKHADVTQQFYDLFMSGAETNLEQGVDGLADAFAKHAPLFKPPVEEEQKDAQPIDSVFRRALAGRGETLE